MSKPQSVILADVAPVARFVVFSMRHGTDARAALVRLRDAAIEGAVVGVGAPMALALGARVDGLRAFVPHAGPSCSFPSTQGALWACVVGEEAGSVLDRARAIRGTLGDGFDVDEDVAAFKYREGRDLSGYVDGTENPKGERAHEVAIVASGALTGGSFVAVQKWVHALDRFARFAPAERDAIIGRRIADDEEISDAPAFAHVKRSAQESFEPTAFMLRRSMPWGGVVEHGLYFVAYGASLEPFERVLARMSGAEDGVVDGLLRFSRATTGGYYFCPPTDHGKLDLRALGI